jgi:hypothetical protein
VVGNRVECQSDETLDSPELRTAGVRKIDSEMDGGVGSTNVDSLL